MHKWVTITTACCVAVVAVLALAACQPQVAVAPREQRSVNATAGSQDAGVQVGEQRASNVEQQVAPGGVAAQTAATALPARAVPVDTTITVDVVLAAAVPPVSVAFETSGRVTKVNVTAGQRVKAGDVLAELDSLALQESLLIAREQLALKRANIANSLLPASDTDIKTAESSLASANAAYSELKKGVSAATVEQALRSLNQSKNSLYSSQLSRDMVCRNIPGKTSPEVFSYLKQHDPECKQTDLNVQAAELRLRNAEQQYADSKLPATQADLARAWSNSVQAQANLAKLKRGVSAEQKAVYDLQIKQAEIVVARAERALKRAQLLSPCACVVQTVQLSVGALATGAVSLLDTTQLQLQTSNLSERDVVTLKSGQRVSVRMKAVESGFTGTIESILPQSSGVLNGSALYTALIVLDSTDAALLPGMTGQIEIEVK